MTKEEYQDFRRSMKLTQAELAKQLGVQLNTVSRRETGEVEVTTEAELAIRSLSQTYWAQKRSKRALESDNGPIKPITKIIKRPMAWWMKGSSQDQGKIFQYSLEGLPVGQEAFIAEFPHRGWKILRSVKGVQGTWYGSYETDEAAIEALKKELEKEYHQSGSRSRRSAKVG